MPEKIILMWREDFLALESGQPMTKLQIFNDVSEAPRHVQSNPDKRLVQVRITETNQAIRMPRFPGLED